MRLLVAFFDSSGNRIEQFTGTLAETLAKIGEFVTLHGTDPDGDGEGATSGRIEFQPIND